MKRLILVLCLIGSIFSASTAFANALPPHMDGAGLFTFKSSVEASKSKAAATAYVKKIKAMGIWFIMAKTHDGGSWGTKVNGVFHEAFSKYLVDAAHAEGLRVYGYFTVEAKTNESIDGSIVLTEKVLAMGADGIIADDLGLFGTDPVKWERLFKGLRETVNRHKGTILASSTFPHLSNLSDKLCGILFKYSDFFLPQEYWMQFQAHEKGVRTTMQPQNAIVYGQAQFDMIHSRYPDSKCKLIPVGRTYDSGKSEHKTGAKQINRFLEVAKRHYPGVGLFVIEKEPKGGWGGIKKMLVAYHPKRLNVVSISIFDKCNAGVCDDRTPAQIAKDAANEESKAKKAEKPAKEKPKAKSPAKNGAAKTKTKPHKQGGFVHTAPGHI